MKISEIFLSQQGEGNSIGKPSVFIRVHGCNNFCKNCDSFYAWKGKEYRDMKITDILKEVVELRFKYDRFCDRVVITGGEPLLKLKELEVLVSKLKSLRYYVEVETNGTIAPSQLLFQMIDKWTVSPKLSFMSNRNLMVQYSQFTKMKRVEFKFVVRNLDDLFEVETLVIKHNIPRWQVTIMPEGTTTRKILRGLRKLADACLNRGFRLLPREQTLIWGNKRGK